MNKDILNIVFNDVLENDINSIKKISLICRDWRQSVSNLSKRDHIQDKLDTLQLSTNKTVTWDLIMKYAARYGHMDIIHLAIEKGASNWNNGMYDAAKYGHIDIVKLMIEKGADGWMLGIMHALIGGNPDIFKLMEQLRDNIEHKN